MNSNLKGGKIIVSNSSISPPFLFLAVPKRPLLVRAHVLGCHEKLATFSCTLWALTCRSTRRVDFGADWVPMLEFKVKPCVVFALGGFPSILCPIRSFGNKERTLKAFQHHYLYVGRLSVGWILDREYKKPRTTLTSVRHPRRCWTCVS